MAKPWYHLNNRISLNNGQPTPQIKPGTDYLCRWLTDDDGRRDRGLAIDTPNFSYGWKSEGFWRRKNPPVYDWVIPIPCENELDWNYGGVTPELSDVYGAPTALINLQAWSGRQATIDPRVLYLGRFDYTTREWLVTLIHFASIGELLVNSAVIETNAVRWVSLPPIVKGAA